MSHRSGSANRTSATGDWVAVLKPATHVRGIALIAIAVALILIIDHDDNDQILLGVLLGLPAIRVAFFMDARAGPQGIRLRMFSKNAFVSSEDLTTVRFVDSVSTSLSRGILGKTASLTIYGRDLEPFRLALYEGDPDLASAFAAEANEMYGTAVHRATKAQFAFVDDAIRSRSHHQTQVINTAALPALGVTLGGTFAVMAVTGSDGANPWLANWWALPVCLFAAVLGMACLVAIFRWYQRVLVWEPYAAQLRRAGEEAQLEVQDQV